jgi:hypothetical protein
MLALRAGFAPSFVTFSRGHYGPKSIFAMLGRLPMLAFVANRVVRFTGVPDVIILMTGLFAQEVTPIGDKIRRAPRTPP